MEIPPTKLKRGQDIIGVEVSIPIRVADYQYIKLGAWFQTSVREGETETKAYRRAWKVAENELEKKREEYERDIHGR